MLCNKHLNKINTTNFLNKKGAHSPDARVLSMGIYPVQAIKSQILGQDDVSGILLLIVSSLCLLIFLFINVHFFF